MMCGDGKESIRPANPIRPVIISESLIEPVREQQDPLKQAIEDALGVYRS